MRELSLFTGAGGGLLGTKLLGWTHIGYVEYNEYCQQVIAQRIKDGILDEAPIFTDIREFIQSGAADQYRGIADVVTGGFPCQDISCAGSGEGINGERSGLWSEMSNVIRKVKPRYVLVENSPMLTIRGLGTVLRDLASMGFNAEWGCISAERTGAIHKRDRVWIVAHSNQNGWRNVRSKFTGGTIKEWNFQSRWGRKFPIKRLGCRFRSIIDIEWLFAPRINRIDDGLANQVDRLKAVGNGQDPFAAATAWNILSRELK